MGTLVTVHVVSSGRAVDAAVDRAFGWFDEIESRCTRFDPHSELMQLTACAGAPVPVSAILFEAVRFAVSIAEETDGAFDPTIGNRMAARGFNREYRSGTVLDAAEDAGAVTWRDVVLDSDRRTISLLRPLTLDLGAVAKGLAIDTAARELAPFRDFAIDAGGDLYFSGINPQGEPWTAGIRHPHHDREFLATLRVSGKAICTSGNYERPGHLLNPRTGHPADLAASSTVIAPSAMLADALATAAFVLGPSQGIALLDRLGVEGLIVTPALDRFETRGFRHAA